MLEHTDEGTGEVVLLLHSGGMSSRQWRKLAQKLLPKYRVVMPDFLGSGKNPPWPSDAAFAYPQDVAEVRALLDKIGAPAHVVGHSYGGFIALKLALEARASIRSVALYDPVAFGVLRADGTRAADEEGLRDLARASENPVFLDQERGGGEEWFHAFVDYWNGEGSWNAMPEPARQNFLAVGRKVFMEVDSLIADHTPASAYASLSFPALFLTGEKSPAAARRLCAILKETMPHASLTELPGQGHMGPITAADAVNDFILAHLDRVAAGA